MTFITENNIANLYSALIEFPVFDEYKLPPASKVDFVVSHDDTICGEYQPPEAGEPHVIIISTAKCGHLDTVIKTLCHEIIHMICYLESPKTEKYVSHKGLFLKLQKRIANNLGYDPKEL
jgi:hypothetical protein